MAESDRVTGTPAPTITMAYASAPTVTVGPHDVIRHTTRISVTSGVAPRLTLGQIGAFLRAAEHAGIPGDTAVVHVITAAGEVLVAQWDPPPDRPEPPCHPEHGEPDAASGRTRS